MKTVITIDNQKIIVSIDDNQVMTLDQPQPPARQTVPALPIGDSMINAMSPVSKKCQTCGKEFFPLRRTFTRAKFCSPDCRQKAYGRSSPKQANQPIYPDRVAEINADFKNPYDCGACLNVQCLCTLHEKMVLNGHEPPKYRSSS